MPRRQDMDDGLLGPRRFVSEHGLQAKVGAVFFGAMTVLGVSVATGDGIEVAASALFSGVMTLAFVAAWRRPASLTLDDTGWTNYSPFTGILHGRWDTCGPFTVHGSQVRCTTHTLQPPDGRRSKLYRRTHPREVAIPHGDDSFNGGPVEMDAVTLARMLNRYRDHYGHTEDILPRPSHDPHHR